MWGEGVQTTKGNFVVLKSVETSVYNRPVFPNLVPGARFKKEDK